MKRYICLFLMMLLLFWSGSIKGQYNPNNPPEPNALYQLNLQVYPAGAGTVSGAGQNAAGANIGIYAYNNTGFRFQSWKEGDSIISSTASYSYKMPARNATLTAVYTYDPNNPGEPVTPDIKIKSALYLEAQPAAGGTFNITGGTKYEEGQSVYLYAYTNTGFKFVEWRDGETVISSNQGFYYAMPGNSKKLTAVYKYEPGNPSEPGVPSDIEHGLIALTQYGDKGKTIAFPVYLLNQNISVHSAEFDIAFPANVTVDYSNAILSARINGHTKVATTSGNNSFHYSIQGSADFSGSNGILISIPLTLPSTWASGVTYPVTISNVVLGTAAGTVNSFAKQGALGVNQTTDNTIKANFYPNIFLNRVSFVNLSTETATSFAWNFGDGTTSAEMNPLHVFASGGVYNVRLIASNTGGKDTITIPVEISPASSWALSGTFSLNKHRQDLKNFSSARELFLLLSQANITGDVTVNVEAGETFDWSLLSGEENQFSLITGKLSAGNCRLLFQKEGTTANPVIQFSGAISAQGYGDLIRLGRWIKTNQVEIKILGQTINLQRIYSYLPQQVCSKTNSQPVDFSEISGALSYNWSLVVNPASITGYTASGVNRIPAMTLTNSSNKTDSLRYKVSIMYTPSGSSTPVEVYSWEYKIIVLPLLQGELKLLTPVNNDILNNSTVSLSWTSIANAVYDLYIYEEGGEEPATATVSQIQGTVYQSSALFQYGKTYRCKVVARNECNRIESATITFTVDVKKFPDLKVTAIELPDSVVATSAFTIKATIANAGEALLEGKTWSDGIYVSKTPDFNLSTALLVAVVSSNRRLAPGESYNPVFNVIAPVDSVANYYYFVTTDINNEVYESDESNNRLAGHPVLVLPTMMDANDYIQLKAIYNALGGDRWNTKWNTGSSQIGNYWYGVSFENGRVTALSLPGNGLTGALTGALLKFPYLTVLNLYDNQLTGSLDALLADANLPGSLTTLNLGRNQLQGNIPATLSKLTGLNSLDLSYNRLTGIEAALPAKITYLNLQYQTLEKDSIALSKTPLLNVPAIARYDHAGGNFNAYPTYSLYASDQRIFGYAPVSNNQYRWDVSPVNERNFEWKYDSGTEFTLVQESGVAKGSSCVFKLSFDPGDANVDQAVDIFDLQHTLNYIFNQQVSAFNFAAGNTYNKDNVITIQDIIQTINIIFEGGLRSESAMTNALRSDIEINNTLSIENGKLVLFTEKPVAAMDIRLAGVLEKDISPLLDKEKFQFVFKDSGTGTRLILISFTRDALFPGRTVIATIGSRDASLIDVKASDPDAQPVPIRISSGTTGVSPVETGNINVYADKGIIYLDLPQPAEQVSVALYTLNGMMVDKQRMKDVPRGKHAFNLNVNNYPNDYILNLTIRSGGMNVSKNFKILLKK